MDEQEELRELGSSASDGIRFLTVIGQIEGHLVLPSDTKST